MLKYANSKSICSCTPRRQGIIIANFVRSMQKIIFFFPFLVSGLIISCSPSAKNDEQASAQAGSAVIRGTDTTLKKGVVISRITCKADTSLSYALYLPKYYSPVKKYPLIYFFDSHGSGSFPLEKYRVFAEKYGYILAGSNNSKNGMNWEQNHSQIKVFMDDVKARLPFDAQRIYSCGFSGGSRVACSVAIYDGGVSCVIGMGAGLPNLSEPIHNRFDYIGFAGNEDFNMNEMIGLTTSMDKSPIRHHLILFNGKHEWAPPEVAEDAFVWLQMNAMKDKLIAKNDSLLKKFVSFNAGQMKALEEKKDWIGLDSHYKKLISFLDGLYFVDDYKLSLNKLDSTDAYKKAAADNYKLVNEELAQQREYSNDLVLKDMDWWRAEIKKLHGIPKGERALMKKRLLSYLSLVAYMSASSSLESRQTDQMEKFLIIYQLVDPENSEHQYLYADMYAIRKDNSKAFASLQNAVKLGFSDAARLEADPLLKGLRENSGYTQLLEKVKSNR